MRSGGGRAESPQGNRNCFRFEENNSELTLFPPEVFNSRSPSTPSTSNHEINSEFNQSPPKSELNFNRRSRNRRRFIEKPQSINKFELISSNNEVNSSDGEENKGKEDLESDLEETEGEIKEYEAIEGVDSVMLLLQDFQLGFQEPEISEEQLSLNDQLQQDELLAMESIYGENVIILDNQIGFRNFQIHIHIVAPEEMNVTAKQNLLDDVTFKVQYLPPIVLTCLLPRSYPSHHPPRFAISVQWLDSIRVSSLCLMLDSIWKEQGGQEVVYSWADWLQSCSLSYLGFDKEIILAPSGSSGLVDRRAVSGSVSVDVVVPFIRSYNDEKRNEDFLNSLHECCICFTEYAGIDFVRLPCRHFFCRKCTVMYSEVLANEGSVKCPEAKCEGIVPPGLLKTLLSDKVFERWEALVLEKTLDSMSDIFYCPRCETPCIEDEDHHSQCSNCFFNFCTLCREKRHVGVACLTPELKLRILQERLENSSHMKEDQVRKERGMINELQSVVEILRDAKQCPSCNMAISKTEGCNKMVCRNCGKCFCYLCNKAITDYEHFRDGRCALFSQEEIRRWEEMNPGQVAAQVHA